MGESSKPQSKPLSVLLMNQMNSPKERLTDRKRTAIMEAAVSELRASGFDNTSMDRIAEVASVSKRTVYNHFPSKEALFAAIVDELMTRCSVISEFPYDPDESLASQLTAIGRATIDLATSNEFQDLARVTLSRFIQSPEIAREMMIEPKQFEVGLVTWINAAQKAGRLKVSNPQQAAKQFQGLINSFVFWPQLVGSEPPLSARQQTAVLKSSVAMFLDHYAS